jgi:hypothetical protein
MSFNMNLGNVGAANAIGGLPAVGCRSIFGLLFGLILIPLGFGLLYWGEARLVNHGKVFEGVVLTTPDAAAAQTGALVKIKGRPAGEFLKAPRTGDSVVYWHKDLEEYQEDHDSHNNTTHKWHSLSTETKWANFKLGPVSITPEGANPVGEKTVYKALKSPEDKDFDAKKADSSPQVHDQRLTIEVIPSAQDLIVMGQMGSRSISGGATFVVSALDDAATAEALKWEYRLAYLGFKFGAGFALWLGILCFMGPLMSIVGWIPVIGDRITGAFAFAALFISAAIVWIVTLVIKLFWVVVVIALLVLILIVWRGATTPRQRPTTT